MAIFSSISVTAHGTGINSGEVPPRSAQNHKAWVSSWKFCMETLQGLKRKENVVVRGIIAINKAKGVYFPHTYTQNCTSHRASPLKPHPQLTHQVPPLSLNWIPFGRGKTGVWRNPGYSQKHARGKESRRGSIVQENNRMTQHPEKASDYKIIKW